MSKKLNANFYALYYYRYERIPPEEKQKLRDAWAKEGQVWDERDYWMVKHELPDGRLYSGWDRPRATKIRADDLPAYYVEMYDYKKRGYLRAAGVVSLVYHPSPFHNHTFRDDFIYISYTKDLGEYKHDVTFQECDEYIWGHDIVDFIKAVEIWSPEIEVEDIKMRMVEQYNLYCDEVKEGDGKIERFEEL